MRELKEGERPRLLKRIYLGVIIYANPEFVNGKQYGVAKASELKDGRFRVLVLITMPITQPLICSVSGFYALLEQVVLDRLPRLGIGDSEFLSVESGCPATQK